MTGTSEDIDVAQAPGGPASSFRSVVRNSGWNVFGKGLPLIAVVLGVPYLLNHLGDERFGLLSLVLAILAYANALNLGLGKAITHRVAGSIANGTRATTVAPSVWSATPVQAAAGTLGAVVLWFVAPAAVDAMSFSTVYRDEAVQALRLLGIVFPVILVGTSFRGLLEAEGRFDLVNLVLAPVGICQYSLPVLAVALGYGIPTIVLFLIGCQAVAVAVLAVICLRRFPELRARPHASAADLRALLAFGGWIAVSDLVFPMFTYLDRFLVAALAGVARLPVYVIPHEIVNRLWLLPTGIASAVFPVASAIDRRTNRAELSRLYGQSLRLMVFAVVPVAAVLTLFSHDLLSLWISPSFADEAAPLLRILSVGFVINAMSMLASALLQGQGMPRLRAAIHLIEIPGFLLAAVLLIPAFGVIGAAWAWVARMAITTVTIQLLLRTRLGLRPAELVAHGVHIAVLATFGFYAVALLGAPSLDLVSRIGIGLVGATGVTGAWLLLDRRDRAAPAQGAPSRPSHGTS